MNLFANIDDRFKEKPKKTGFLCADGGSRGNPGVSGAGAVIYNQDKEILWQGGKYTGINTNNFAEYHGLILGLQQAQKLEITHLQVFLDSKLAIEQMNGNWKVKHPQIKILFQQAKELAQNFLEISFTHIPRAKNKKADELANRAMDRQQDF
ncbi:hypothetical protein CSB37_02690 [bacterium DOLZORAL124_38_8]|nr:MAG: hypothetical protein CSB37_02690 [bacterium DOLZORAL124_38_8]